MPTYAFGKCEHQLHGRQCSSCSTSLQCSFPITLPLPAMQAFSRTRASTTRAIPPQLRLPLVETPKTPISISCLPHPVQPSNADSLNTSQHGRKHTQAVSRYAHIMHSNQPSNSFEFPPKEPNTSPKGRLDFEHRKKEYALAKIQPKPSFCFSSLCSLRSRQHYLPIVSSEDAVPLLFTRSPSRCPFQITQRTHRTQTDQDQKRGGT
jgi:hypothetical protein